MLVDWLMSIQLRISVEKALGFVLIISIDALGHDYRLVG